MTELGTHLAIAVLTRDYPGTFLAVTEGYAQAYKVGVPAEEMVGRSLADFWPGIIEPGHPYHKSWTERHAAILRGGVGDVDHHEGETVTFVGVASEWEGQPAILLWIMSSGIKARALVVELAHAALGGDACPST